MAIMSGIAIATGGTLMFFWNVAMIVPALGLCILLLLPTFLSYKCLINKELMEEEYFILFFKKKKTVYWRDVKYKKVKTNGRNKSITLYNFHFLAYWLMLNPSSIAFSNSASKRLL